MNKLVAALLLLLSLTLSMPFEVKAQSSHPTQDVVLAPHESQSLSLCARGSVQVSPGGFFKVLNHEQGIKIIGLKKGSGQIRCALQSLRVHIVDRPQALQWSRLSAAIASSRQLQVAFEDALPVVRGQLEDPKELSQILDLNGENLPFLWKAKIPGHLRLSIEKIFLERLRTLGLSEEKVSLGSDQISVQLPDSLENKKIAPRLQSLGISVIGQPLKHPQNHMVSITLYFVEARSQFIRNLGLQWPTQQTFQILPTATMNTPLDVILKLGENHGFARTLATPQLVVRSGEKGEFVSGGEFPIRIAGFQSQSLFWKKYGLQLFVNPQVDASGGLVMDVKFEVSMIDPARTVDGLPGLLTHQMQTQIQLEKSQPLLISRLIKEDWGTSRQGLSGLKDIPLFGKLFQSEDFLQNKSDLFIFIEPKWSKN